jgi:glycosyltransferase involved in cell wall biosynthesis
MQKTNFPIEIIIHDDASTDNTAGIVKEYVASHSDLIFPIYQKENQYSKGVSPLINFVFPRAHGKYIALCEGDDYWTDPYKLQKQVDFLEANIDFSATGHQTKIIYENSPDKNELFSCHRKGIIKKKKVVQANVFHTNAIVFRSDSLFKLNITKVKIMVEHALFILLAQSGDFYYFHETMSVYRRHSKGISAISIPAKAYPGQIAWISGVKEILGKNFFWGYHFLTSKVHLHYAIFHPEMINKSTYYKYYFYLKYMVLVLLLYPRNVCSVIRLFPKLVGGKQRNEY